MFHAEEYMRQLIEALKVSFGERLIYVGLQGSYMRGEATEESDIDPMVLIDGLSIADLDVLTTAIAISEGQKFDTTTLFKKLHNWCCNLIGRL